LFNTAKVTHKTGGQTVARFFWTGEAEPARRDSAKSQAPKNEEPRIPLIKGISDSSYQCDPCHPWLNLFRIGCG
jgi:hypothetical protein